MSKRLIVLRHAKSAWDTDAPSDHARPLSKRGRRDAPRVAEHLVSLGWIPEAVFSSDSERTRQTFKRMHAIFGDGIDTTFTRALYHAGLEDARELLVELADTIETAMIIGHNPGWDELVSELVDTDVRMTTCNAALLSLEADDWTQALDRIGQWRLEDLIVPRDLR